MTQFEITTSIEWSATFNAARSSMYPCRKSTSVLEKPSALPVNPGRGAPLLTARRSYRPRSQSRLVPQGATRDRCHARNRSQDRAPYSLPVRGNRRTASIEPGLDLFVDVHEDFSMRGRNPFGAATRFGLQAGCVLKSSPVVCLHRIEARTDVKYGYRPLTRYGSIPGRVRALLERV